MGAPDPIDVARFDEIPDPAASLARRPAPAALSLSEERSPTRSERRSRLAIGAALALAWASVLTWRFGFRPDIGTVGVLIELVLWAVTAVVAIAGALNPGLRGVSPGVPMLRALLAGVPAVFLVCAAAWSIGEGPLAMTWQTLSGCLGLSALIALGPLGVTLWLFKGAFAAAAPWRLSLVGAVCGLTGTIGCHAHCSLAQTFGHVALGHGMPILLGAVVGALYGELRGRA